jgi:signal transduction histidine kinase
VLLTFALASDGRTSIDIADNGPGVSKTLEQDIFLPFFTTKEKGTGIGLSLARQIVLAHGGSIVLDSSLSEGALFRLLI